MISSSEKRRLMEAYQDPVGARAAVAKAIAGLVIIIGIAVIGTQTVEDEQTAQVSSQQAASGR
jgi:hypothetical protein